MFAMETDQSMSDFSVKSWIGTIFQTPLGLSCVTFFTPNKALKNFVFMYFVIASASYNVSNAPILINVSVAPSLGATISVAVSASPNTPFPFDFGNATLYLSMKLLSLT